MSISTLMAILWADVIQCFSKKNNKNNKDQKIKTIKIKVKVLAYGATIYLSFDVYFICFKVPCKN